MREWDAPEKADILVSELLGSFGDNELSPECLDGAQKFLKGESRSLHYTTKIDHLILFLGVVIFHRGLTPALLTFYLNPSSIPPTALKLFLV